MWSFVTHVVLALVVLYPDTNTLKIVDSTGETKLLSKIAPRQPTAIVVIKGLWCPVCLAQVERLAALKSKLRQLDAQVIVLGPEKLDVNSQRHPSPSKASTLPFSYYLASAETLHVLGFWISSDSPPMPGLIFLDKCGQVWGTSRGRHPDLPEEQVIMQTLEKLRNQARKCGRLVWFHSLELGRDFSLSSLSGAEDDARD